MDVPTPRRRTLPVAEVTEPFKYSPRFLTVKLRKRVGPVGKRCREEADTYPTGLSCSSSGRVCSALAVREMREMRRSTLALPFNS